MNTPELLELVRNMRDAQKRYFAKKDNLQICIRLEQAVDQALAQLAAPPTLFNQRPAETEVQR